MSLRLGDIFGDSTGTYEVTEIHHAGGFGQTFFVTEQNSGIVRVAKAPSPIDEIRKNSIRSEFRVLDDLKRKSVPFIVRPITLIETNLTSEKFPVLVMETAAGKPLNEVMKDGPLAYPDVSDIMSKLAHSLKLVHQNGYMHLDIAPDNIFIEDVGGRNEITIIDFGIAAQRSDTNTFAVNQDGHAKPFFGAPEVRKQSASCGSDIFSVGATGFALILGDSEFQKHRSGMDNNIGKYDPRNYLPQNTIMAGNEHLNDVIKKATWGERAGRFSSMEDLENAVAGKEPDENFPRLVADGKVHRMTGEGPWLIGRENPFGGEQPDIIVQETSPTNKYISKKHAIIERRQDGILILKNLGINGTRYQITRGSTLRWLKVREQGYPLGSRHQIFCFGYADHPPNATDRSGNPLSPGPYKTLEFFPPKEVTS